MLRPNFANDLRPRKCLAHVPPPLSKASNQLKILGQAIRCTGGTNR